jgi:hypothetical protein
MSSRVSRGYLLIADISGYTAYVAQTEIEHSQGVLSDLLEVMLHKMTPRTILSKLEGDAVFCYAPEEMIERGELLVELVEAVYFAFRDRVATIHRNTTCQCNACRAIPTLDLKFIVHFGEYMVQSIAGMHELVGTDVNLVHRLTKNRVSDETGWRAYALFTAASSARIGLDTGEMHRSVETLENFGDVTAFSTDLGARYAAMVEGRRVYITADEAHAEFSYTFDLPLPVAWDWWTDLDKRNLYFGEEQWSNVLKAGGRTAPGATNHCAHGNGDISVETILDWRPLDYYSSDVQQKMGEENDMDMTQTHAFTALDGGRRTRYTFRIIFRKPNAIGVLFMRLVFGRMFRRQNKRLERLAKQELAAAPDGPDMAALMGGMAGSASGGPPYAG